MKSVTNALLEQGEGWRDGGWGDTHIDYVAGHTRMPQATGGAVQHTLAHPTLTGCEEPPSKGKRTNQHCREPVSLPPTAPESDPALSRAEWLFVKHAPFTQTPLLPAGRLRKGQRKGGSRGGEARGLNSIWLP